MTPLTEAQRASAVAERLAARVLADRPEATDIEVTPVPASKNGFSNETELFDATWRERGEPYQKGFVLRTQVAGREVFYDTDLLLQWDMMDAVAQRSKVPVPELVTAERDASVIGSPFFVMGQVPGRVPPNATSYHVDGWIAALPPAERRRLIENALSQVVQIHALDWKDGFEFLDRPARGATGLEQYLRYAEEWMAWAAKGRSFPVLDAGLEYLLENQPEEHETCVNWGDCRIGNMIFAPDDVDIAAVIDWEMAVLGPPELDVAWWLMFEDIFTKNMGIERADGVPDRDETVALYEQMSGRTMHDLDYYETLAYHRMAITCVRVFAPEPGDDQTLLAGPGQQAVLAERLGVPLALS
jgi:aminoglycoside phosphotransferase (APT) family kinase protein